MDLRQGNVYLGQVALRQRALEVEAIEVLANRGVVIQKDMDIGSFEVDAVLLKEVPQLEKDVFKLIKFSPSVTVGDEFSPLYNVRGSDPGENLVQLDGMTIYNPQHFLGAQAVFNPYAIKNIEMLVGGFDAQFGGRNASILYLTTREGHKEKVQGEFKPSTEGLEGAVEFPLEKLGTAVLSGRVYTDLVTSILLDAPNYRYDLNAGMVINWKKTRLRFSLFTAQDFMDYDAGRFMKQFFPDLGDFSTGFLIKTDNLAAGVQTRTILTPNLILETHAYHSGIKVNNRSFYNIVFKDSTLDIDHVLRYETRIQNGVGDLTLKGKLVWFTFGGQQVNAGFELNRFRFENEYGALSIRGIQVTQMADLEAWYIQDKIELGSLLLKIGLRNSRFSPSKKWILDPRTSLAFQIGTVTLKAAWGIYHQFLTSMNTQDIEVVQFVDYYYPLQNMDPLESEHYILGWEHRLSNNLEYSLTGYYKDLRTLYRYNYQNTIKSLLTYNAALEKGTGESFGVETLLRGEWGRLSGWLTYVYSVSKRRYPSIQNGKPFLADGDQTHQFKSLLALRVNRNITASTTIMITSGYPKTWETGLVNHYSYDPANNSIGVFQEYITPVKNNVRFPARMYVDFGWRKKLRSGFGHRLAEFIGSDEAYFTMNVKNVLFLRRNPQIYIYYPGFGYYGLDLFGIFPLPSVSMGYSIKF